MKIHKVILRYRKPPPGERKQSVYRTDAGIGDARDFAVKWAAYEHIATVTIHQGRRLIETIKPVPTADHPP